MWITRRGPGAGKPALGTHRFSPSISPGLSRLRTWSDLTIEAISIQGRQQQARLTTYVHFLDSKPRGSGSDDL